MSKFMQKYRSFLKESLDISNLEPNQSLHGDFWNNKVLNKAVQSKLTDLANDIMEQIQISEFIEDIIITGSIASYNWHSLSDVDLHFLFDFKNINEDTELVKKMLDLTRMKWNKDHKIMIFGHEVEIYFQDVNEPHESLGTYSILRREWTESPQMPSKKHDKSAIAMKAGAILREIDRIQELFAEKRFKESFEYSKTLKKKIKNMRSIGLSGDGVYSVENLAFKVLRNNDKLSLLSFLKTSSYDTLKGISKLVKVKSI